MKKISQITLAIITLFCSTNFFAQSLNYTDLSILFSEDKSFGTSRFAGLNGAMGAIGGDLSATNVNPAGAAIFSKGEFNFTLSGSNYNNESSYYNTTNTNTLRKSNLEQIGGVLILKNAYSGNTWNKIALAVNYQLTNKFDRNDIYSGNSGYASFINHPNDDVDNFYANAQSQELSNFYEGEISKLSFTLAADYEKFNLGVSLNFHNLDFYQESTLNEISLDDSDNTLNTTVLSDNRQNSDGFSIGAGIILKPTPYLRLGAAVESKTWFYNIQEDSFYQEIFSDNEKNLGTASSSPLENFYEYPLNTPGKLTFSSAFIIGKTGFINIDYTYKAYDLLSINPDTNSFTDDNKYFDKVLQNTNNVNIGGELRLGKISLRAGVGYQQTPFKDNLDPQIIDVVKLGDLYSGSIGIGTRIGNSKFDIAYRRTQQENEYDFNDLNQRIDNYIQSAIIKNDNSTLALTYTYIF